MRSKLFSVLEKAFEDFTCLKEGIHFETCKVKTEPKCVTIYGIIIIINTINNTK
jgi:hypothetical protein